MSQRAIPPPEKVALARQVNVHPRNQRLSNALVSSGIVVALTLLIYLPANLMEFAGGDDVTVMVWYKTGNGSWLFDTLVGAGRHVSAPISGWTYSLIDSVGDLRFARMATTLSVGLVGASIATVVAMLCGRSQNWKIKTLATLAGIITVTTTASTVISTTAIMSGVALALPIAMAAGIIAATDGKEVWPKQMWVATALIFVATFTYQPFALVAMLPPALWAAHRWATSRPYNLMRVGIVIVTIAMSLAANYAAMRVVGSWAVNRLSGGTLLDRLTWFTTEVLPRSVDLFVPATVPTALLSAGLLVLALFSSAAAGVRFLVLPLSVLFSWAIATLAMFPSEMHASYRVLAPSQFILWGGSAAAIALSALAISSRRIPFLALGGILLTSSLALMFVGYQRAYTLIAQPNAIDWASAKCIVKNLSRDVAPTVRLTPYPESESEIVAWEYGGRVSGSRQPLPDFIWLAFASTDEGFRAPAFTTGDISIVDDSSDLSEPVIFIEQNVCGTLQ